MAGPSMGAALHVSPPDASDRRSLAEPVTIGVPFARGLVRDPHRIGLLDEHDDEVPLQVRALELWPDGSVRWALLDFQAIGEAGPRRYTVAFDGAARPSRRSAIQVLQTNGGVVVDTGAARFDMRPGTGVPFASASADGAEAVAGAKTSLVVTDAAGRSHLAVIRSVTIEEGGALRSTIRLEGAVGSGRRPLMDVIARCQFFAGSSAVRLAVTLRNPRRARHRGGFWELGDRGSVFVRDASLRVTLPGRATAIECSIEREAPFESCAAPVELYQDSSGGAEWRHATHVNRDDVVPCAFRGYRFRHGADVREGLRSTPAVRVTHAHGSASLVVEHFWQNFPKAIEVEDDELRLRVWPRQFGDLHELQGGEQKTHRCTIAFGDDPLARDAMWWGRAPSVASMAPEWYAAASAVPYLSPASADPDDRYQRLVNLAIEGGDSFERKRETIDEYGWRHFGDIYADHENPFASESAPIVSHYNNQYDGIGGGAVQFMRTADARWWRLMNELAAHVTDIDIYHTDRDKAAYNNGLFWHTYHYVGAGRSSHRSYPRRPGVSGGGPANEHNYTSGLRWHWLLTGDPLSREAAIGLATWVLDMDDGRKTVLRWLSRSDTGLASATQSPDFHGPGRGAGHSIIALLDGHRLTGERRFLIKAEQVIRRCVHPADDIAALNLLDAEQRWSYTAFLQALAKYLGYKAELGERDLPYAYGRETLLHYARWMADHEYPYLEKPEILEYPTETWAAQDMRKCEVFTFAAAYATGTERDRFLERAAYFFDYSVSTLLASETRSMARPVVLMLSNGFAYLGRPVLPPAPVRPDAAPMFGAPTAFQSQKAIAKRRLPFVAGAAVVVAVVILIAFLVIC